MSPCANYHKYDEETLIGFLKGMNRDMVKKVILFAQKHHNGQTGKIHTDKPFILHPLRVACLLYLWGCDASVISAGVLHDILEKTDVEAETIAIEFSKEIRTFVDSVTEFDKKITDWRFGKKKKVARLPIMHHCTLLITFAERFDRMVSLNQNFREYGDEVWEKLEKKKDDIEWYFGDISYFISIQSYKHVADYMIEYARLYREVFEKETTGIILPSS